jgi:hypothetical protein
VTPIAEGRISNWLQIAGNLAILGGLVLVGIQINQVNELTGVQMVDANMESSIVREIALMGENPNEAMFRVLLQADEATPQDYFVAERVYGVVMRQILRAIAVRGRGVESLSPEGTAIAGRFLFASPHGRIWLDGNIENLENSANPDFVELARILSIVRERLGQDGSYKAAFEGRINLSISTSHANE